jgi:hypothetical protein
MKVRRQAKSPPKKKKIRAGDERLRPGYQNQELVEKDHSIYISFIKTNSRPIITISTKLVSAL